MSHVGFVVTVMLSLATLSVASAETYTPGKKVSQDFDGFARPFLATHCVNCHGQTEPAGNLSLYDLGPVDEVNSAVWKSVWAQITLKEMPPKDADQPLVVERLQFSDWIVGEIAKNEKNWDTFENRVMAPTCMGALLWGIGGGVAGFISMLARVASSQALAAE